MSVSYSEKSASANASLASGTVLHKLSTRTIVWVAMLAFGERTVDFIASTMPSDSKLAPARAELMSALSSAGHG